MDAILPVEGWHGLFSKRDTKLCLTAFQDSFCLFVVVFIVVCLLCLYVFVLWICEFPSKLAFQNVMSSGFQIGYEGTSLVLSDIKQRTLLCNGACAPIWRNNTQKNTLLLKMTV